MKARKKMGFTYMAIAFMFLFEPSISALDLLPDFIGYIFMCIGISQLADLNEYFGSAYKRFFKMIFINTASVIALVLLFGMSNAQEKPEGTLLLAFVAAVLNFIIVLPAFLDFFNGFTYLATRVGGEAVFYQKKRFGNQKNITDKLRAFTAFFVISKNALVVLPELSVLVKSTYNENSMLNNLYEFIGVLRFFSVTIGLIIGIVWLVRMLSYLKRLNKDEIFMNAVRDKYNTEIAVNKELFLRRYVNFAFIIFSIGIILLLDIYADNYNLMPDAFCAFFIFLGAFIIRKYAKSAWITSAFSALYFAVSVIASLASLNFYENFRLGAVHRNEAAYNAYYKMCTFSLAEGLAFCLMIISVIILLKEIIEKHTGFSASPTYQYNAKEAADAVRRELKLKLIAPTIISLCSAIFGVLYDYSRVSANNMHSEFHIEEFYGLINMGLSCAAIVAFISLFNVIKKQMEYKYMIS